MREIKFRAWDKKSKKMRVVYCIVYDTNSQFSKDPKIKLVNLWGRIFPAYDDGECNAERLIQREPKHVELMQYTGLKDKNGKEIYEGDIVRWGLGFTGSWDNESWHRYAVAELFPSLQFRIIYYIIEKTGEKKETDNHVFEFGSFAYKETHKYLEVIGNIYENTELLN